MVADAFSSCVFDNHSTKAYPIQAVATMNEIMLTDDIIVLEGPMEVLNMDYKGPFPEDEKRNTHVLAIIDTFTRTVGLLY